MASESIRVVRAFIAAINRHSLDELGALLSDDHRFVDSLGHVCSGRDALMGAWRDYLELFPDYAIRADTIVAQAGLVAVFGEAAGTIKSRRRLVPANRIAMPAAWQCRVQDGRIALWQVYADWSEGVKVVERVNKNDRDAR